MRKKIVILICLLSASAFSLAMASVPKLGQCVLEGQWVSYNGVSHNPASVASLLSQTNVVLLGEDHDNPEHHRWQLQTLSGIYALQPNMVLGFEAFPRSTQKILDQWVAGELSEKEFLEAVDWDKIWRFNKDYYMPMFHFARMNRIPMYALNVDRKLVSRVGSEGWDNIPEKEREGVSKPAAPSQAYIDVLADVFSQHMPKHAHRRDGQVPELTAEEIQEITAKPSFQHFLQGQLLWDRAMAEVFYDAVKNKKHPVIVGILGAGHIMGHYGVPHQLNAMGLSNIKTLMAWDNTLDCQQLRDGAVDIAFGIAEIDEEEIAAEQERPRLGVYLEHNKGVLISRLVKGSVGEASGIQQGDRIVRIAGKAVEKVSDVVEAVRATAFGTWLPMTIDRGGKKLALVAKFPARSGGVNK
ncbi:MAG TPA: PDZ domain-containing protein [Gammaproteobacteria bacterium]|nr:PDZ domain-containing protein [Gammaproteobacteria bacterium]